MFALWGTREGGSHAEEVYRQAHGVGTRDAFERDLVVARDESEVAGQALLLIEAALLATAGRDLIYAAGEIYVGVNDAYSLADAEGVAEIIAKHGGKAIIENAIKLASMGVASFSRRYKVEVDPHSLGSNGGNVSNCRAGSRLPSLFGMMFRCPTIMATG